jgi:DNA invertase Pin-like site-specific DNA recombinase
MKIQVAQMKKLNELALKRAAATDAQYREKISKGTKEGLKRARALGVKLGGRKPKVSVKEVRSLRRKGLTQQQIAKKLGVSQPTVSLKLRSVKP